MTNFPMASGFGKDSADSTYEFAVGADQPLPEPAEKNKDASAVKLQENNNPFNYYEEMPSTRSATVCGSVYETVNLFTAPIYSNLQGSFSMEAGLSKLVDDSPYNFATEIPSVGVPSFSPPRRSTTTKKPIESADDSTYINSLSFSGENNGVILDTTNAVESNQAVIAATGKKGSLELKK